ncbi:helix-turn-helix transcriptional regulator [Zongyangia hominis]|uniref:Helix-turn-helix transcriptional regulator n=1 Tax=Zongyangia hominis TaxID=2763677 RepID=A0A926ECN5_9FIRM|nr:helix-turn-helix transcriptional regulator [Zongyangia hominis]MBC8569322.1 helix-turn-helix transcriptional regulator [Zongyangia hominis]
MLVRRRSELGYTQEHVAEKCNISARQYQAWEKGDCLPTLPHAIQLAIVLDFSLDSLKKEVNLDAVSLPRD